MQTELDNAGVFKLYLVKTLAILVLPYHWKPHIGKQRYIQAMFTLYGKTFPPARKKYRIGLLFTLKNSSDAPIS